MRERFTIRKLRESKGLDIVFLARQFEASERQIEHLEVDSSEISYKLLDDYLDFFQISYDVIYIGNDESVLNSIANAGQEVGLLKKFESYLDEFVISQPRNARNLFYSLFSLIVGKLTPFLGLVRLPMYLFFIIHELYHFLSSFFLKSDKNNPRFALARLFVLMRTAKITKLVQVSFILGTTLPTIFGLFIFHELPHNGYGYFYAWPSNLVGVLVVFSLWKKIKVNYFEKDQKNYFEVLEQYFPPFIRIFIPALFIYLAMMIFKYPQSNPYLLTNYVNLFPFLLNLFFINLLLFLFFLPMISLKYPLKSTLQELYPFPTLFLGIIFMVISPLWDLIYRHYDNLNIFYVNSMALLLTFWSSYWLIRYRMRGLGLRRAKKKDKTTLFLGIASLVDSIYIVAVGIGTRGHSFNPRQNFVFIPFVGAAIFFLILFLSLMRRRKRGEGRLT
ncbi:MAG: helix-turn-helix domain-containing protein [Streptococcaceae bacterium]|jgi:hypothetical protein|nr:helix-turn-helix domain-containing protein [Streptococcaceae bacterium]